MSGASWAQAAAAALDDGEYGFSVDSPALATAGGLTRPSNQVGSQREFRAFGVVVGSDDPFTRQAFRSGANGPGVHVLAEGTVTSVADELAVELKPDIVLLDVQIAAASGLCAIQRIRARLPDTRILACSAPAGTEFGLLCLRAGAWGYVSKEIDLAVLPSILWTLGHGEAVIPRALATELVRQFVTATPHERHDGGELSTPECRLLELLRTGLTVPDAAAELGVTLATARRHLGSARRKLSAPPPLLARESPLSGHRNLSLEG